MSVWKATSSVLIRALVRALAPGSPSHRACAPIRRPRPCTARARRLARLSARARGATVNEEARSATASMTSPVFPRPRDSRGSSANGMRCLRFDDQGRAGLLIHRRRWIRPSLPYSQVIHGDPELTMELAGPVMRTLASRGSLLALCDVDQAPKAAIGRLGPRAIRCFRGNGCATGRGPRVIRIRRIGALSGLDERGWRGRPAGISTTQPCVVPTTAHHERDVVEELRESWRWTSR